MAIFWFNNAKEVQTIARRPFKRPAQREEGPRINEAIQAAEVQLIDENGENLGIIGIDEALAKAGEAELDLVEVSGNAEKPVCKIMDYGKYKYQAQKKAAEARKKTKTVDVKEIKMRPNIDQHDYDVKMRAIRRFFEEGDKVKVTLRFRGREMAHQQLGMDLLHKVRDETEDFAKVELEPKLEGRQMIMVLAPR
jgi:translation initiation factor IF-3